MILQLSCVRRENIIEPIRREESDPSPTPEERGIESSSLLDLSGRVSAALERLSQASDEERLEEEKLEEKETPEKASPPPRIQLLARRGTRRSPFGEAAAALSSEGEKDIAGQTGAVRQIVGRLIVISLLPSTKR